ncbi:hypothetical protein LLE67_07300 [Xanthomonas campestris]|uniref:hypothetical protein n=1 Tax=Xanthomonas campestris TaxID=339 RepID=UPI001E397BD0|nr:hypothetical protein [Xanthomonas campestris]MCC5067646.1 hypothetical protein [Xanthomonas campestris]
MTIGLAYDRHRSGLLKRFNYDVSQPSIHRGGVRIQALRECDAGVFVVRRLSAPSPTALAIGSLNRNRFGVRPQVQGQWRIHAQ